MATLFFLNDTCSLYFFIKNYQTILEGCFTIADCRLNSDKKFTLAEGEYSARIKIGGPKSGTEQMKN